MDTTVEKWRTLVDRLIYHTSQRKVKWSISADDGVYVSRISGTQISIHETSSQQSWPESTYIIKLYNGFGEVIDSFSDEDISDTSKQYYTKMKSLYKSIVRLHNGSEDVLDKILKELPNPDEIPF